VIARLRSQRGATLIELLVTILVGTALAAAVLIIFQSGLLGANSRQSQGRAQSAARLAVDRFVRDARQALSPDGGTTAPVAAASSTSVEFYVDPNRSATATTTSPTRVRYSLSGTQFVRQVYSGGAWSTAEVLAQPVMNTASTPVFTAFDESGTAMASPVSSPADVSAFRIDLLLGQKTGASSTTTELTTDVTLRNAVD
jgi:Tfp pilus assembly protein PilW